MDLLRSEPMQLVQLIIPNESAHRTISYLGDLGLFQFNNVSHIALEIIFWFSIFLSIMLGSVSLFLIFIFIVILSCDLIFIFVNANVDF